MRHVRIDLGYDGTDFFGSQSQPGRRTVQGELERILQRIAPGSSRPAFAGRTDRGVHAVGQVASLDVAWRDSDDALRDALNALAPRDLAIRAVESVDEAFHARYDAVTREYRYRVVVSPAPPVLERRFVLWRRTAIDARCAAGACRGFIGEHAFGTFAGNGRSRSLDVDRLVRRVHACEWRVSDDHFHHELRVIANGFLPQMVRNMAGAVIQVGSGQRDPAWIDALIDANDRRALGDAAPPEGLVLWRVRYAGDKPNNEQQSCPAPGRGYEEE